MYKLQKFNNEIVAIQRLSDNASIPMVLDNMDFVEYNKWLSEGNQPLPPDAE